MRRQHLEVLIVLSRCRTETGVVYHRRPARERPAGKYKSRRHYRDIGESVAVHDRVLAGNCHCRDRTTLQKTA